MNDLTAPLPHPIVLAGPTASGKSSLALKLALKINAEIICGDSAQVYKNMRIGTAGPSNIELKTIAHHGFHHIDAADKYDAARFIEDTDKFVQDCHSRGKNALIVGGSGLYLRAFRYGLNDVPQGDLKVRLALEKRAATEGNTVLHTELATLDLESAKKIHVNDRLRIVRALEVFRVTGQKPSDLRKSHLKKETRTQAYWFRIDAPIEILEQRIKIRAAQMFKQGLLAESIALKELLGEQHPQLQTMGYFEALKLANGEYTAEEALAACVLRQRRYAKSQRTWFKKERWWSVFDALDLQVFEKVTAKIHDLRTKNQFLK